MKFLKEHETKIVILFSIITVVTLYYKSYGFSIDAYSIAFIVTWLIMLKLYIKYNKKF